jgi:hypothetical protein
MNCALDVVSEKLKSEIQVAVAALAGANTVWDRIKAMYE